MSAVSETKSKSDYVNDYVTDSEDVHAVAASDSRTFAVTDRRILDVTEGRSSSGRSIESIESTLFTDVAKVDISIQGSTTNRNILQVFLAVFSALFGVLIGVLSSQLGGSLQLVLLLVGLVAIGVAVWLYRNATETIPGGINIRLRHKTPDETVTDRYVLPENQDETARAVLRGVGNAHNPPSNGGERDNAG